MCINECGRSSFILYTSGSTGKPKGVLHTTGGYLVYASFTHKYSFDYHPGDVYWCTADPGWIETLLFRLARSQTVVKHYCSKAFLTIQTFLALRFVINTKLIFYLSTVLRSLMKEGNYILKNVI